MNYLNVSVSHSNGRHDLVVENGYCVNDVLVLAGLNSDNCDIGAFGCKIDGNTIVHDGMVIDCLLKRVDHVPVPDDDYDYPEPSYYCHNYCPEPVELDGDLLELLNSDPANQEWTPTDNPFEEESMTVVIYNALSSEYEAYLECLGKPPVYNGLLSKDSMVDIVDLILEDVMLEVKPALLTVRDRSRGMIARFATDDHGFVVEFFNCLY